MTETAAVDKRAEKAQDLRVIRLEDGINYVESSDGKVCYRVDVNGKVSCTCGDFAGHVKRDPDFKCKHILAVLNGGTSEISPSSGNANGRARLDERFLSNIQGKDFVLYAGLLDLAHQHGLIRLEVEPLQIPTKENGNLAICRAIATTRNGEVFSDIGDADPGNVNRKIAPHIFRMASTRAKARALRDLANIGITCLEELGDVDDVLGGNGGSSSGKGTRRSSGSNKDTLRPPQASPTGQKETRLAESQQPSQGQAETSPQQAPEQGSQEKGKSSEQAKPAESKGSAKPAQESASVKLSEAQRRAIENLAKRRGLTPEELGERVMETFGTPLEDLTPRDAASYIRTLQQSA
ncbi:MAG TPA: SWIM zinc finger domain-containing protein [bacterium]|nr:SWIM zinc finger domain-containing protein [bacterium]